MKIKNLNLKNFRNYEKESICFDEGLNVLVGKNAQGKTNIIEAIFFAVIGKSFKTSFEKELIKYGSDGSYVSALFDRKYREVLIEYGFSNAIKKSIKIDGISLKKLGELLGEVNAVFFSPDELRLIKDSPEERRKFMNIDISQTDKRYYYQLSRYEKILASRNKLLKTSKDLEVLKQTIDIWDRALAEIAEKIFIARSQFLEELSPFAALAHDYISGNDEKLSIKYISSFSENYKENMLKALQKNLSKDFKLGFTSVGIHRDEIELYVNGVEVKKYGSQGQQRTVALSLKLAELEIIKNKVGEYPILLLDDVFSELDEERRKRLLNFTSRTQTIITCTDFNMKIKAKIIKIENGKIKDSF